MHLPGKKSHSQPKMQTLESVCKWNGKVKNRQNRQITDVSNKKFQN